MNKSEIIKGGVVPPMLTAFKEDGSIDEKRTCKYINFLIDRGIHGVAPGGSTGEFISMTIEERKRLIKIVVEEVKGRIPVYAGVGHYSTDRTLELSEYAEKVGVDGLMIMPPYYFLPPKEDVLEHFRTVAKNTSLPIIFYNNVWFVGIDFTPWEYAVMVEEGIIQGVKEAHGDPVRVHTLKYLYGNKLTIFYGHDYCAAEALLIGADGWLSGVPSVLPGLCVELYEAAVVEKNVEKARKIWERLLPFINLFIFLKKNDYPHYISFFKRTLEIMGVNVGNPRRPLRPLNEEYNKKLKDVLKKMNLV